MLLELPRVVSHQELFKMSSHRNILGKISKNLKSAGTIGPELNMFSIKEYQKSDLLYLIAQHNIFFTLLDFSSYICSSSNS